MISNFPTFYCMIGYLALDNPDFFHIPNVLGSNTMSDFERSLCFIQIFNQLLISKMHKIVKISVKSPSSERNERKHHI